ncbi:hypothetical protein Pan241w_13750 [Gimesia alba]|uniref:Uncharacterized protein n=1 Tax=Gimesia alba TaxID=2527973 RepID=A0A517RBS0_9PLAN|nr:hypothetical protein Pan241w_13750 [Gimesia alba]
MDIRMFRLKSVRLALELNEECLIFGKASKFIIR